MTVAPGFMEATCFNPSLVYFIAGLLAGMSYHYYAIRTAKKAPAAPSPRVMKRRRR